MTHGLVQQLLQRGSVAERLQPAMEFEFATSKGSFQTGDELSPEEAAENLPRGEERLSAFALFAVNPT